MNRNHFSTAPNASSLRELRRPTTRQPIPLQIRKGGVTDIQSYTLSWFSLEYRCYWDTGGLEIDMWIIRNDDFPKCSFVVVATGSTTTWKVIDHRELDAHPLYNLNDDVLAGRDDHHDLIAKVVVDLMSKPKGVE